MNTTINKNPETMTKKIILFALIMVLLPASMMAQSIFDKYSENPDVTYVNIKPKMFQMLAKLDISTDDAESQAYLNMVNSITSFKTIITDDKAIAADISKWMTSKQGGLDELMEVKDDGREVKFYVKEGRDADHVKELLIFVNGIGNLTKDANIEINGKNREIETVVALLTGDIDLNEISKLTSKMNIPGGEHLKNK
ncbi:DUF4252 domain-containing protein [Formosa algae]|uniref:DUF4252 domain-containing protein n=1 Tax=Formosa algae TaxID=225843 RepID=A0A9X0YM69_9FLAO|nr:DUF4252 domain-containing protein [Formosa algae]MBP1839787.1 hypothetical protein [Formosa algae]MDQ0335386.1 hypothetical protein [Formosa algae]